MKITVLMAVHDGEAHVEESIRSILGQEYRDFEFLIVNDASTDETPEILATFAQSDPRIRVLHNEENLGLTRSLNLGLEQAKGDYIARQDADDISLPTRLGLQARHLDDHPEAVLVTAGIEAISGRGRSKGPVREGDPLPDSAIRWMLLFYNYLTGHSLVMFRRSAALNLGGYNSEFRYSQDYELWIRMAEQGEFAVLEPTLLQLRLHKSSISKTRKREQRKLGLSISQKAIEDWSGERVGTGQLEALRSFWKAQFRRCGNPAAIHEALNPIFLGFIHREASRRPALSPEVPSGIRQLVASQFRRWDHDLTWHRNPFQKREIQKAIRFWESTPEIKPSRSN